MTAPVIPDAMHNRALAASARLSDRLATPPAATAHISETGNRRWYGQSLYRGAAGTAILHGIRAEAGHGPDGRARIWLAEATREEVSAASSAGLWFGVPAIAFAITTGAPRQCPTTLDQLDNAVARLTDSRLRTAQARAAAGQRPALAEFDLVRGLTGLGAYLLHRRQPPSVVPPAGTGRGATDAGTVTAHHPDDDLIRRIIAYLVQLTEPASATDELGAGVPGWWSSAVPSGEAAHHYPGGHADLGIAHGISGPLALLALAMRADITVPGHADAIERICAWLDRWRQDTPAGVWWPERIGLPEVRSGTPRARGPARPSWCYGTPGIARAQQLAAITLGDTSRRHTAEEALAACMADTGQLARFVDGRLCHGWAGLVATAWYAAADAATDRIAVHLPQVIGHLTGLAEQLAPHGPGGLIDGDAGIALTLHTVTTGGPSRWAACLLLT